MSSFEQDKIENEKDDPKERSSLKFVNVPLVLLAMFFSFGVSYLGLRTDKITMEEGDSRTKKIAVSKEATEEPKSPTDPGKNLITKGKQVYTSTCQACHQQNGSGIAGAFPPLSDSQWVNGNKSRLSAILLHGIQGKITVKQKEYNSVMPAFKDVLSVDDIAAVASYVRNSFGNSSEYISVELVKNIKEETKDRSTPWGGEKELNEYEWK